MPITPPVTFGPLAMAVSTLAFSWSGSAPTLLMMAERLFSPESSSAFSRWMVSTDAVSASPATPMAAWKASWAVTASLSSLMVVSFLEGRMV